VTLNRALFLLGLGFLTLPFSAHRVLAAEGAKVAYAMRTADTVERLMAFTLDSVGVLKIESSKAGMGVESQLETENGFERAIHKRAFSPTQKDTAQLLLSLTQRWKGVQHFTCLKNDGYAFSVRTDSLSLDCKNCFSCTDGMNLQDAKRLARLGKLTLWLYKLGEEMPMP
jgi:hypothetical protein